MRTFLGLMLVVLAGAPNHAFANEIGVDELPPAAPAAPAFSANDSCPVETSHKAPEDYYPPGSIRRSESGEVLIEFTAEVGAAHPRDVVVVQGSGFERLDNAALKIGRSLEVSTVCGAQRVRRYIVFEVWRDPRDQRESIGCLVFDPAALTVLIFPYDES